MPDTETTVSLPVLWSRLRRHAALIVLTIILAVGVSVVLSATATPTYTATSAVGFNDDSGDLQALGIPASPSFQPEKQAAAQGERITRPAAIAEVKARLNTKLTTDQLSSAISTSLDPASNLVTITAKADSAKLAANIANTTAEVAQEDATSQTRDRYRAIAKTAERRANRFKGAANAAARATYQDQAARLLALATFADPVDIVRSAQAPSAPTSPKPVRNAIIAAFLGIILGVGLALLRLTFDRRLREQEEIEEMLQMPVVGQVRNSTLGKTPLAAGDDALSGEEAESFRIIRTNVAFLGVESSRKTVLVTSPLPQEGKSTVATGLAWAEAIAGHRTLVVDCDLRRPTLADRLGIDLTPGLSDYLLGDATPAEILRPVAVTPGENGHGPTLVAISAGRPVPNQSELLASERFRAFLEQVSQVYDRVVLDTAPLLPVSDTIGLLHLVDELLVCVRLNQTTRDDLAATASALQNVPSVSRGVVLTAADKKATPYYVGAYAYASSAPHEAR